MLIFGKEIPVDQKIEVVVKGPAAMRSTDYDALKRYFAEMPVPKEPGKIDRVDVDLDKYVGNRLDNVEMVVDDKKFSGNFRERVQEVLKFFKETHPDLNIPSILASVDIYLRSQLSFGTYYVEIHPDVDWSPGTYHEAYGSCWWRDEHWSTGRVAFRYACKHGKAFALRYYRMRDSGDKAWFEPAGRCFVAKLDPLDQEAWALFNAYGPNRFTFAAILQAMTGVDTVAYKTVALDSSIFINDSTCPIICKEPDKLPSSLPYYSYWSEYEYDDDLEYDRLDYVEHECEENCENCGCVDGEYDVYYTYDGQLLCERCLDRYDYVYSDYHGEYVSSSDCITINTGEIIHKDDPALGDYGSCATCDEWYNLDDLDRVNEEADEFLCPECLEEEKERIKNASGYIQHELGI